MQRRPTALFSGLLTAALLAIGGCSPTSEDSPTKPATITNPVEIATAREMTATNVAGEGDEQVSALAAELFEQAQLVIVTDEDSRALAASAAIALGAPVLPMPESQDGATDEETANKKADESADEASDGTDGASAADELTDQLSDLGARYVLALGNAKAALADAEVLVLEESQLPDILTRLKLEPSYADVPQDDLSAALADLEPGQLYMADPQPEGTAPTGSADGAPSAGEESSDEPTGLPEEIPPLVASSPASFSFITDGKEPLLIAQARAAGGDVTIIEGDPRSRDVEVTAPDPVVAAFGDPAMGPMWAAANAGVELPGGGQLVFDSKRYIALYGSPASPALGVLGEQGTEETIARAEATAKEYAGLTEDEVIPALEIIVTVASGDAGDDGNYSNEWDPNGFVELIEAAEAAGQYVILDFQPGRTDFLTQVKAYEQLLAYPHVGVALDPEWRLGPDELPLSRIGHVEAAEVNEVVDYLATFVRENNLPQKALVLHQFQLQMLRDRDQIDVSRPELAVVIHADGQGSQSAKADTWQALHVDAPDVHWGWKNFYDEDSPMLSPEETYQVEPLPDFVSYQ